MTITCIIIEDQPPAQRVLQKYINDIDNLKLLKVFDNAIMAMEFLKNNSVDLIFLDIHLPKLSGIDFLNILTPKPKVILTTAFPDYALQSYDLDVTDYLLKPFSFQRFLKAVNKVNITDNKTDSNIQTEADNEIQSNDFLFIKSGFDYIKLFINDIAYIKSDGDYTLLVTNSDKHLVSYSLKYWVGKLNSDIFCQVHKSYLVNINYVNKISGNTIYINNFEIPIGRAFKDSFNEKYLK